jgi:hypothetical protein
VNAIGVKLESSDTGLKKKIAFATKFSHRVPDELRRQVPSSGFWSGLECLARSPGEAVKIFSTFIQLTLSKEIQKRRSSGAL